MRAYISVTVCGKITPVILHGVVSPECSALRGEKRVAPVRHEQLK